MKALNQAPRERICQISTKYGVLLKFSNKVSLLAPRFSKFRDKNVVWHIVECFDKTPSIIEPLYLLMVK